MKVVDLKSLEQYLDFISQGTALVLFHDINDKRPSVLKFFEKMKDMLHLVNAGNMKLTKELCQEVEIIKVPQLKLFKNGCEISSIIGIPKEKTMLALLNRMEEKNAAKKRNRGN